MRQLLYTSTSTDFCSEDDLATIVEHSRHNNAMDGVTGLLWSDGARFMQVIEGPAPSIAETYRRISHDPRHRDLIVVHDREVATREFGGWSMASRRLFETEDDHDRRLRHLLEKTTGSTRNLFADVLGLNGTNSPDRPNPDGSATHSFAPKP